MYARPLQPRLPLRVLQVLAQGAWNLPVSLFHSSLNPHLSLILSLSESADEIMLPIEHRRERASLSRLAFCLLIRISVISLPVADCVNGRTLVQL